MKIVVDFITKMLKSKAGNACIVMIVDVLTKRVHFMPTTEKDFTAETLAKLPMRDQVIAAYILSPLLSQYYFLHIVNLFVLSISYDAIPYLMSSSFYSILSVSSVVAQCIALQHTHAHKPVLILVVCFTYLVFYFPHCFISYYMRLFLT